MQSAYARSVMTPVNIPNMDMMQKAAEQRLHCKCYSNIHSITFGFVSLSSSSFNFFLQLYNHVPSARNKLHAIQHC